MNELIASTLRLYGDAARETMQSFTRGWMSAVAVTLFAGAMILATQIAAPLGILGGFLLGAVNALLVGATLSLIEQTVKGRRRLLFRDVWESVGHYFWDVIGVGFVLWIPMLILERGMAANPNAEFIGWAILLLLFILLNPAPEVIYQVRHDSPLDVFRESYEFVLANWIEWFLPLALVLAPLGLTFFFDLSHRLGRGAGLHFFQVLVLPFTIISAWLAYLGLPRELSWLVVMVTPALAVAMLMFRGHLFAALHGSSRRQRMFRERWTSG